MSYRLRMLALTGVPSEELKRFVKALHRGVLPSPITRASLIASGFGNIEGGLSHVVGRDVACALAIVACVLAERKEAEKRLEKALRARA